MISLPKLFTTALAATSVVIAAATPQQIADGLNFIAQKSRELQSPAQSITLLNAPLIVINQGPFPQLIAGFDDLTSTATTLAGQIGSNSARMVHRRGTIDGEAADLVFNAFRGLVRVQQELLNILIGKSGILQSVPLIGAPVAKAIRGFEAIFDSISITLINMIPSRANDFISEANSLGGTLTLAIQKYEGLAV